MFSWKGDKDILHVFLVPGQVIFVHQLQSKSRVSVLPNWQNLKPRDQKVYTTEAEALTSTK